MEPKLQYFLQHFRERTLEILPQHASAKLKLYCGEQISLLAVLVAAVVVLLRFYLVRPAFQKKRRLPPAIPGVPILGNLLQLGRRKPHHTFTAWAEKYGPIFTISTGADTIVVISSAEIAKEAMITKFSSISSKKLGKGFLIMSRQKTTVVTSDYGDEHRLLKKVLLAHLLGPVPQKNFRTLRENASFKMLDEMYAELQQYPGSAGLLNIREYIKKALYAFSLYQIIGRDPDAVFVEEMGRNVSRWESFDILIMDPVKAVSKVDWRDFFPAFKWVPNKAFEDKVNKVELKKTAFIRALIKEQKKLLANGKRPDCYLDTLLTQATDLTQKQLEMLVWEPFVAAVDTTLVTTEWIMYELAKQPNVQERLYNQIMAVAGDGIINEDHLSRLPYLTAIIKETLRKYPPAPQILPRFVEKDVQLGGYDIPPGWQIIVNIYGINYSKKTWPNPEVWDPDRELGDEILELGFKDNKALPFGIGKRMCPGITQAMFVISTNVAYYVQHFRWILPPDDTTKHVDDIAYFTSHRLHPLKAIVTPRVPKRLNA